MAVHLCSARTSADWFCVHCAAPPTNMHGGIRQQDVGSMTGVACTLLPATSVQAATTLGVQACHSQLPARSQEARALQKSIWHSCKMSYDSSGHNIITSQHSIRQGCVAQTCIKKTLSSMSLCNTALAVGCTLSSTMRHDQQNLCAGAVTKPLQRIMTRLIIGRDGSSGIPRQVTPLHEEKHIKAQPGTASILNHMQSGAHFQ
jgi:primosomal replication protein N